MLCNAPFWLKLVHSTQILAFSTKIFPASLLACKSLRMAAGSDPTLDHQKFPKFLFLSYNIYKLIYNVSHSFLSLFNVKRLVIGKKVHFQPIVGCTIRGLGVVLMCCWQNLHFYCTICVWLVETLEVKGGKLA